MWYTEPKFEDRGARAACARCKMFDDVTKMTWVGHGNERVMYCSGRECVQEAAWRRADLRRKGSARTLARETIGKVSSAAAATVAEHTSFALQDEPLVKV